ncbi:MAG: DUF3108 domain-containing protein [Thermoanaerobaculia bacterium]
MNNVRFSRFRATGAALLLALLVSLPAAAAAGPAAKPEEFRYSWRLRGILGWIADFKFPNSGSGELRNIPSGDTLKSELVITGDEGNGARYVYRSEIAGDELKTLMTFHGYAWDGRTRNEQTRFDYDDGIARIRKEREGRAPETKVRDIPAGDMRDVLTGIHFLRKKAGTFTRPLLSEIYSDGTIYPVEFRPLGSRTLPYRGKMVPVDGFEIGAVAGDRDKWPGGVRVWLTSDAARIPLRIEIRQSFASLQLDLQSVG